MKSLSAGCVCERVSFCFMHYIECVWSLCVCAGITCRTASSRESWYAMMFESIPASAIAEWKTAATENLAMFACDRAHNRVRVWVCVRVSVSSSFVMSARRGGYTKWQNKSGKQEIKLEKLLSTMAYGKRTFFTVKQISSRFYWCLPYKNTFHTF